MIHSSSINLYYISRNINVSTYLLAMFVCDISKICVWIEEVSSCVYSADKFST